MLVALFVTAGWIVSVCLHEFAHALVAYLGGDRSVKDRGYLTLNPFKYTHPGLTLILPTVVLLLGGIALPGAAVYINERMVKGRLWLSAVSAAGPAATALCAAVLALLVASLGAAHPDEPLWQAAAYLAYIEVVVLFLNLIPVPGMDGYGILEPFLPGPVKRKLIPLNRYGLWLLLAVLWFAPPVNRALWITSLYVVRSWNVPGPMIADGMRAFHSGAVAIGLACIAIAAIAYAVRSRDWSSRTQKLLSEQRFEELIALLDKELLKTPDNAEILKQKGLCCAGLSVSIDQSGSHGAERWRQQAREALEKACALAPNDASVWSARGMALTYLGDYKESAVALNKAIELAPDESVNWYHRGLTYQFLGEFREARSNYERAVELDPEALEPMSQLAALLIRMRLFEDGLAACQRAIALDSRSAQNWHNRGMALLNLSRPDEARASFEKALALVPADANAWYYKACCCARLGDDEGAFESLSKAVELDRDRLVIEAASEPYFAKLREDPRFREIVSGAPSSNSSPKADGNGDGKSTA